MSIKDEKVDNESYSKNFTRVPNILFIAYCDLTKEEKYLYSDLRRIYWDMKPRFVSLRELSGQTRYSVSALSKMLPRLHDAGLVHAEIQREKARNGREKGMPKYHITIIDIWEINRLFFSCSQKEQVELAKVPSAQLVHEIEQTCSRNNTSLFTKNDKPDTFGEQDQAQVERAKDINKDTSKDTLKESNMSSSDDAPSHQSEKEKKLEREVADLRAQIAHILQATDIPPLSSDPGGSITTQPEQTPPGTPLTPAGENHLDATGTMVPNHNAIPEPPARATDSLTQETHAVDGHKNKASENALHSQEMPSSTQAVDESNRQATEQPQQQASAVSPIATETTKKPGKSAGGRGKGKGKEKVTQAPLIEEDEPEATPPQEPPVEMKWGTRKCLLLFDFWRGAPLLTDFKLMQASKCAKPLASYYTEDEVRLGKKRMDADDYYKKRGSVDIMDVANNIQRYVKKKSHLRVVSTNTTVQAERPIASTEGSQYIVDEIEDAALASIAAMGE